MSIDRPNRQAASDLLGSINRLQGTHLYERSRELIEVALDQAGERALKTLIKHGQDVRKVKEGKVR